MDEEYQAGIWDWYICISVFTLFCIKQVIFDNLNRLYLYHLYYHLYTNAWFNFFMNSIIFQLKLESFIFIPRILLSHCFCWLYKFPNNYWYKVLFVEKANQDASEKRAQVLWSACQALIRSLKAGCPGQNWRDQLRPLNPEISAVQKAAGK